LSILVVVAENYRSISIAAVDEVVVATRIEAQGLEGQ
jgi:hypothetical protein